MRTLFIPILFFSLNALSTGFIKNIGQLRDQYGKPNPEVLYIVPGKGLNIHLRKDGFSYEVWNAKGSNLQTSRVDLKFKDPHTTPRVIPSQEQNYYLNYFNELGDFSNVPVYQKVEYKNVFPEIDILFHASPTFKYDIILHPGADLKDLQFLIEGAQKLDGKANTIQISTSEGEILEEIPCSYYLSDPTQKHKVVFTLNGTIMGFNTEWDGKRIFIIDPASTRLWGTYYGDAGVDYGQDVANDANGNVYLTGYTLSNTNIATNGTYQSTIAGSFDAFIAKFDVNGVRQWGTYYGGNSVEAAYAITISNSGAIYISGDSFSTSGVASVGAHQTSYGGGIDDAFLARFDQNGQRVWSTYYGGLQHDISYTICTDANNNVILGGHTESPNAIGTPGSFRDFYTMGMDVFIAKFDANGVRLWGTYFGDINDEEAWGICADNSGNIFCTGFTASTSNISIGSPHQVISGGMNDAFVFKLSPGGNTISWCSYYGGNQNDVGTGIRALSSGDVILCGNTSSPNAIASVGAFQGTPGSADDAFLARLTTNGIRVWGTYFGGNDVDYFEGMQVDPAGDLALCGSTLSTNLIATPGAWQSTLVTLNNYDAFLTRFNTNGNRLSGTYYGGSSNDNGYGISVDGNGALYICGVSTSADSIASTGAHMTVFSGGQDAFLARFCLLPVPVLSLGDTLICEGDSISISTVSGPYTYSWNTGSTLNYVIVDDTTSAGTYPFYLTLSDNLGCTAYSDTSVITIDLCNGVSSPEYCAWKLNSEFYLQFCDEDTKDLRIYSLGGNMIFETAVNGSGYRLPVGDYSVGIYLLEINEKGAARTLKFRIR